MFIGVHFAVPKWTPPKNSKISKNSPFSIKKRLLGRRDPIIASMGLETEGSKQNSGYGL